MAVVIRVSWLAVVENPCTNLSPHLLVNALASPSFVLFVYHGKWS